MIRVQHSEVVRHVGRPCGDCSVEVVDFIEVWVSFM